MFLHTSFKERAMKRLRFFRFKLGTHPFSTRARKLCVKLLTNAATNVFQKQSTC
jgi:hypothetical protein